MGNSCTSVFPNTRYKCLYQHTDDESPIQSTKAWLGRRHLAFAVANCVLNLLFAAALLDAASMAEAATGCWRGQQYDGKCSFYFNCYFFCTTPTNRDLREKAVYFPARAKASALDAEMSVIVWSYSRYRRRVFGDIGDCCVGVTPKMYNRVTNHGDMGTFSRPALSDAWCHCPKLVLVNCN